MLYLFLKSHKLHQNQELARGPPQEDVGERLGAARGPHWTQVPARGDLWPLCPGPRGRAQLPRCGQRRRALASEHQGLLHRRKQPCGHSLATARACPLPGDLALPWQLPGPFGGIHSQTRRRPRCPAQTAAPLPRASAAGHAGIGRRVASLWFLWDFQRFPGFISTCNTRCRRRYAPVQRTGAGLIQGLPW